MACSSCSEAGAGVDAELVDEAAADPGDGGQRFSLAAGTVLGEREQLPPALPQRCRLGEGLGLGEDFAVVAGGDGRFEPPFLGVEAELGEAGGFEAAGLPLLELGERASAPQGEGLGQRVRGTVGFAELEELVAAGGERLELAGVDGIDGQGEPVARAGGRDRVGAEDLAEPDDAASAGSCARTPAAVSPQTTSASWSALSASSPAAASAARTSVSRGLRWGAESSSVSGPRTEIPTFRMSSPPSGVVNRACTGSIPGGRGVGTGG